MDRYTYNNQLSDWVKDYSLNTKDEDYKLCVDLTYKYNVKSHHQCRKWVNNLKNYINDKGYQIDGIMVTESNHNKHLHNHCLVWGDFEWSVGKSLIYNYWNKIGSCLIRKYDDSLGYHIYITKFINQSLNNEWDIISNLG